MFIIKRIGVGSAFRVGLVAGAVLTAITGLLLLLLQGLFLSYIGSMIQTARPAEAVDGSLPLSVGLGNFLATFGLVTACVFYVMSVVFSAVFTGIAAALMAFAYNLVARWVGGLEVELAGSLDDDLYL
ncbi:MAG: DUF3566 domain-containing protein [Aggregatilineales bacterium]